MTWCHLPQVMSSECHCTRTGVFFFFFNDLSLSSATEKSQAWSLWELSSLTMEGDKTRGSVLRDSLSLGTWHSKEAQTQWLAGRRTWERASCLKSTLSRASTSKAQHTPLWSDLHRRWVGIHTGPRVSHFSVSFSARPEMVPSNSSGEMSREGELSPIRLTSL